MRTKYCERKNCTYKLCIFHSINAKYAIQNQVLIEEDVTYCDMELTKGCLTRKTLEETQKVTKEEKMKK